MLCAAGNAPPDHEATLKHGATLRGKRVLVVEDEVLLSMLVEDELLDAGATVLGPAPSVGDALRLVEEAAADGGLSAAVLDVNLDGQRVWPVADQLAALGVPFLFATGYGKGCDTGGHRAAPVLHKPFGVEALIATITALASARGAATAAVPCLCWPETATPDVETASRLSDTMVVVPRSKSARRLGGLVRKQSASPTAGDGRSKGTRASHEPDYSRPEPPNPAGRSQTCSGSPR
jgi:DNA-binding response OmpR family regulator